jgi:hypothetical protein
MYCLLSISNLLISSYHSYFKLIGYWQNLLQVDNIVLNDWFLWLDLSVRDNKARNVLMIFDIHTLRSTINYLDKGRLWLWQCHIFRILANSENTRQTTVSIIQILTQKLFFLQNIKDSTLNLTFVMVFSITENGLVACLAEFRQKFPNLNWNGVCNQKYFHAFQSIWGHTSKISKTSLI